MTTDALEKEAVVRERSTRSGLSEFFWIVECLEILVLFVVVRELTHNIEAIVDEE
jgi:hypothetical protein